MNLIALPLLALLPSILAANNTTTSATWIYTSTSSATLGNALIWSVNTVKSTGDVFFHLEAPASGSWAAVGFGGQMANTLMMIAYPSSNGSVTISPRIATGHSEPIYASNIKVEKIWDSGLVTPNYINQTSNIMYVDGVCRNCTSWNGGSLDLNSASAPFSFAVAPGVDMSSDQLDAPLQRHSFFGTFSMNLSAATSNNGAVPQPVNGSYTQMNSNNGTTSKDNNFAPGAHAGLMILSWIIIFPLGAIILRIFDKVILHSIVQCIGVFFVLVSFGLGCYISSQYNRSKSFHSAHQIVGLLLILGLLVQLSLGIVGHRIFKKTNKPAKIAKVHLFLGPILIIIAIINGGIGWGFAGNSYMNTRYAIGVIAVFIIVAALRIVAHTCMRRRRRAQVDQPVQNAPHQYPQSYPQSVGRSDYRPQFAAPKQLYVQSVPLQTFQSTDSMPQYHGQEQQPRNML